MDKLGRFFLEKPYWVAVMVVLALVMLPVVIWADLRNLSDQNMMRQASSLNSIISSVRSYYAQNVVGRILNNESDTQTLHNYSDIDGAIPIPATLSIELGDTIGAAEGAVSYRFASDFPFENRATHNLSPFEIEALKTFRIAGASNQQLIDKSGGLLDQTITLATPVVMGQSCVTCHNAHVESPKKDWKVGDIRGIQTVSVNQPISLNIWSFKWLLGYLCVAGGAGLTFAQLQYRLAQSFSSLNRELEQNNTFLAGISLKISKYLSPQVYRSIFSGEKEVEISTERKKLTVFFSDIKDFTSTAERLQPEELTSLLNEYFTEMSMIAEAHGATIDKFIGDAIVAFFGDPDTKGTAEDAKACLRMALEMQKRLSELERKWRRNGMEHPFQARMGINTGYCNVGNFGSDERMDYTIIGAEANLAARLESIAQPNGIVISYETFAHVSDFIDATPLEPVQFKGIARQVVPYVVNTRYEIQDKIIEQNEPGLKLMVDVTVMDDAGKARARETLESALRNLGTV